ncbi:MAG: hypothetical protein JW951_00875 [Lentisphaerae bacterium]|nr:hypothetical protein [Lentisphaerota bacterium]
MATSERQAPTAIECKWRTDRFDPAGMKAFRRQYTEGKNLVVAQDVDRAYTRTYGDVSVRFVGLRDLLSHL